MRKLYKENEANYPRLCTDKLFADYKNEYKFDGWFEKAIKFTENNQLLRADLWERFVMQFRQDADYEAGWRGEYLLPTPIIFTSSLEFAPEGTATATGRPFESFSRTSSSSSPPSIVRSSDSAAAVGLAAAKYSV